MKHCTVCGEVYEMYQFAIYRKNKDGSKNYYARSCRSCQIDTQAIIKKLKAENPPPPPGTPCACCGRIDRLFIDHDHFSHKMRNWICKNCNVGLGYLGDTEESVEKALNYLKRCKTRDSNESTIDLVHHQVDSSGSQH